MAQNNAINNTSNPLSSTAITIDPGASGDSYVQFNINTTGEFRIGVDDDDSDKFKISNGSALGTNDNFVIFDTGEVRVPRNVLFMARMNNENNITGDGTTASIGAATALTELFDVGGDFSPGNGAGTGATFTAPVTGLYFLNYMIPYNSPSGGGHTFLANFVTSNRTYICSNLPTRNKVTNFFGGNAQLFEQGSIIADMDAADTCTYNITGTGGAKTDDLLGQSGRPFLSGTLLF